MKKVPATLLLSAVLIGCGGPLGIADPCTRAQEEIKTLVERHIKLTGQIDAAGGMSIATQDLKDAYRANQDELKAAYEHSNEVCA